jgi:hypothetical protein
VSGPVCGILRGLGVGFGYVMTWGCTREERHIELFI